MEISQARRIVLKIGSALLTDAQSGTLKSKWLDNLIHSIIQISDNNRQEWLVVSSGAVALGRKSLDLPDNQPGSYLTLEQKQAAASIGQIRLAEAYSKTLGKYNRYCGQILLSLDDTENRRSHLNARNTLETLLKNNVIPIVNENDTVTTQEIRFGDNDRLAARVAQMMEADLLILLSTTDGVYDKDPARHEDAKHIEKIETITQDIRNMAETTDSLISTGGMISKLEAARIATQAGCHVTILDGRRPAPLTDYKRKTDFIASRTPEHSRKKWIRAHLKPKGTVLIDQGAHAALIKGKSLLPVGVIKIVGEFQRGDAVNIKGQDNRLIARGLIAYDSDNAKKIIGVHSKEIPEILGFESRNELVHRNDLVLEEIKEP